MVEMGDLIDVRWCRRLVMMRWIVFWMRASRRTRRRGRGVSGIFRTSEGGCIRNGRGCWSWSEGMILERLNFRRMGCM